jgi:hypothetical protein
MKQNNVIIATVLFLLFGATAIANAQQNQRGNNQNKSAQPQQHQQVQSGQQTQHQQARPAQPARQPQTTRPVQTQARPQQTYGGAYHGGVQFNSPTNGGVHPSGVPQHQGQVRSGFVQSRASSWQNEHRSWSQRGGYAGYRIPDNRFRQYFGRDHFFRIYGLPLVFVGGMPRFQYDGYWVTIMDPWPESWGPNWYETDDVYLDYTADGYYLYDRLYPDFPIAVTVTF